MHRTCITYKAYYIQLLKINIAHGKQSYLFAISRNFSQETNKRTNLFFYPEGLEILETCISILSSKYFWVVKIEKQIRSFIFLVKLGLNGLVSRSTDLYQLLNRWLEILKVSHYSKPSLNIQSCIRGLLVVRDFCFWAV